jgi:hypothetical protein
MNKGGRHSGPIILEALIYIIYIFTLKEVCFNICIFVTTSNLLFLRWFSFLYWHNNCTYLWSTGL